MNGPLLLLIFKANCWMAILIGKTNNFLIVAFGKKKKHIASKVMFSNLLDPIQIKQQCFILCCYCLFSFYFAE